MDIKLLGLASQESPKDQAILGLCLEYDAGIDEEKCFHYVGLVDVS